MRKLVIDHLNPHPLGIVHPPALPVLRMYQVDAAVLEGFSGGLAPIDIFIPTDSWSSQMIIAAKIRDGAAKVDRAVVAEEGNQVLVHFAASVDWWKEHSHFSRPPDSSLPIIRSVCRNSQCRF